MGYAVVKWYINMHMCVEGAHVKVKYVRVYVCMPGAINQSSARSVQTDSYVWIVIRYAI